MKPNKATLKRKPEEGGEDQKPAEAEKRHGPPKDKKFKKTDDFQKNKNKDKKSKN